MVIAVCVFELHIPEARGLKEKRKVVKGLIERVHQRFRVSIAETAFHDLHQRAELAVAAVARDAHEGDRMLDAVRSMVDEVAGAFVTVWEPQCLEGR